MPATDTASPPKSLRRNQPVTPRQPDQAFDGGYLWLGVLDVSMVWGLYRDGAVQARDVRVWLACRELREQRHIAAKTRARGRREPLEPRYFRNEVTRLVGGGGEGVRDSLRRLTQCGLLTFSESGIAFAESPDELAVGIETVAEMRRAMPKKRGRFPMPRRTLRMLCGSSTKATLASVFAQLIHCCYWHGKVKGWSTTGRCKASWVASTFGVSPRSVVRARAHLVELGWMNRVPPERGFDYVRENRWGAQFEVRLDFARTVAERELSTAKMSPQPARNAPGLSPPESDLSLSTRCKNQKPGAAPPTPPTGFSKGTKSKDPNWNDIVTEDLASMPRLMDLFEQALARGAVAGDAFMERLNFAAAAQRARVRGTVNPCGLFRRIIERKLWSHITNDDEESVRPSLTRYLNGEPEEEPRRSQPRQVSRLSEDARMVRDLLKQLAKQGVRQRAYIFGELNKCQPEWTEARWGSALEELDRQGSRECVSEALFNQTNYIPTEEERFHAQNS